MSRSKIIKKLKNKNPELNKTELEMTLDTFSKSISEALNKGKTVEIRGFGSFTNRKYGSYTGRNPKTGSAVSVPPKRLPFFKVGKDLRERVDEG